MSKIISAAAIQALKEALSTIYWYKGDLRSFLQNSISDANILSCTNWDNYKRQIVSDIVDSLCRDQERYLGDIRKLFYEVSIMAKFPHLEHLEDSKSKMSRAVAAVTELKIIIDTHDKVTKESDKIDERRKSESERLQSNVAVREKLSNIKKDYYVLISSTDHNQRGYQLEKIMYDIFELFDLDPKASFKNTGEQIDGAFCLEGADYLFEGKWQKDPVNSQDMDAFSGKIKRKLDNTLGLFLAINGFSSDGVKIQSAGRSVIILMTGADLMAVLEERIDFVSMILRKRRHAAQTGNILYEFSQF
jgi:hypothetical protein